MDGKILRAGFTGTQRRSLKKLPDFFVSDMLQLYELRCVLIAQMVPFDRHAHLGLRLVSALSPGDIVRRDNPCTQKVAGVRSHRGRRGDAVLFASLQP
jgi:hypothetical protein